MANIITSLPVILQNGTTADASQVMADFNAIVNAVNANAAHAGVNSDITNLTALTVALTVPQGGTGQQVLTQNCVLIGEGSSGVNAVGPGTVGQILTSQGAGTDPVFADPVPGVPSGMGMWWPTATPPTGYVEAKGQSTSGMSTTIIAIYGATLPDMRGYSVRGWDDGRGVDPARALLSVQADGIASHSVPVAITDPQHSHNISGAAGATPGGGSFTATGSPLPTGLTPAIAPASTGITAVGTYTGQTETTVKNVAWMFVIKT